jgi:hypothetical protein
MATSVSATERDTPRIRSLIPARIDRLPWSRFHTRLVMALGVAWILDGLEITIASNVGPDLRHGRPEEDDLRHLHPGRGAADHHRRAVQERRAPPQGPVPDT